MAHRSLVQFSSHLRRAVRPDGLDEPGDGTLLRRFADERDESAFAALLERHGPMVWGVCRRVLADADADDAFQATFLVLVRKAGSIAKQESVASWLHGVAHRVALRARHNAQRRRQRESEGTAMTWTNESPDTSDLRGLLDEELRHLPEKYRAPLVLCYLEGKTNDEAAVLLGWTRGTVAGRMARARDLLRARLTRRGLALASGAFAALLVEQTASAAVPVPLVSSTLRTAMSYAAGAASSAPAVSLAEGVLRTMKMTKLKLVLTLCLAVTVTVGIGVQLLPSAPADPPPEPRRVAAADAGDAKTDRAAVVQGNNAFACDLFARLRTEKKGNICFSPYSISSALAMTYAGARGETAEQMAQTLHFTLPGDRLHAAAGGLVREFNAAGQKGKYQLNVANALWGQKGYAFLDDFLTLTRSHYGAGLTELDFMHAKEEARKTINDWVAKQTQDKIKDLLEPDDLTQDTRLVLTNTLYFKATWLSRFNKNFTRDQPFQITADDKVNVPLMIVMSAFPYLDGDSFQAVAMPFVGEEQSMIVFLPKKADGLAEFEKSLTPARLNEWLPRLKAQVVQVTLPRFKVATKSNLNDDLTALGMPRPFDAKHADFSGMNGKRELFIGKVIHEAFVDVNEEGTEAGAATAVVMNKGGAPQKPAIFKADHPFVFLIRDNRTGSVLFLGRVADPRK